MPQRIILPSSRSIIENKLLTALNHDVSVAILATKDDLDVLIEALEFAGSIRAPGTHGQFRDIAPVAHARALAADYTALRQAAFP